MDDTRSNFTREDELASRCIVQVEVEDVIPRQRYRRFKLHEELRELCLSMGEKGFGLQILEYQGGRLRSILEEALSRMKTRYLAIGFKTEIEQERGSLQLLANI